MIDKKDLLAYATKKLGGEKELMRSYVTERLSSAVRGGTTIGQLIEIAKKEDWFPTLMNLPISQLAGGTPDKTSSSGGRITLQQKKDLQEDIVTFLKKNPSSGKSQIAEAVGFEASKVAVQLRTLKASKKVTSKGSKAQTVYSAK